MSQKTDFTAEARVSVVAGFNNTIITLSNPEGQVLAWSTSGSVGFKGARKSTPFAAANAALVVARKAVEKGIKSVAVFVKGPGVGRDSAVRSLKAGGLDVVSLTDVTPIPHNGCRPKKRRRV